MSCADVQTIQAGNGTKTQFSFDFPYIFKSEIKVSFWNATTKEWDEVLTTDNTYPWQVTDANPTIVEFTGTAPPAPAVPVDPNETAVDNVKIRRVTNIDDIRALFNPGSAIRSDDLNKNFEQLRYAIQEANCQGIPDDVDQYLKDYYWDRFDNTLYDNDTWVSDDTKIATTAALDDRVDSKIDDAITGDIATDGTGITITDDGDGTITLGLADNSIDFDKIKNVDIITETEQDAGSPSPADNSLFTSLASSKRFDTIVSPTTPVGSDWEVGKTWLQNDTNKTLSIWNGSAWVAVASGGSFTELTKVIYVDSVNGDDNLAGHRISNPKRTIKAAIEDINADPNGDGSIVLVAPGIYGETFPIDIQKNDIAIVGSSLRNCIIHPAIPVADQAGYDVDTPEPNELSTMFRVNSGSYFYGLTLTGMKASGARGGNALDTDPTYGLPTNQAWNFAFYPGAVIKKSPYIQNCTNFSDSQINNVTFTPHTPGEGAAGDLDSAPTGGGILIDGSTPAANSPLRSMVCDSYTHTALNGPGIFVTNNGYCQATSSYSFFGHYHLKTKNGGQANLAASTSDFGSHSLIADGKSTAAIFTAATTVAANDGDISFTIGTPTVGTWHGSATRPQDNMLVELNGVTYPILSSTANGTGWDVTISRPDPLDRSSNLGLNGAVGTGITASFYLRSMIASSGHTMEYVGSGTDYRALPENGGVPDDTKQITELNNGKVWAAITDHRGTFTVGDTFVVNQQTGFVSIDPTATNSVTKTSVTGAAIIPTGTTLQRTSPPSNGHLRYNTDAQQFEGYINSNWKLIGGAAAGTAGSIQINDGGTPTPALTSVANFKWDSANSELDIPGDINLDDGGTYTTTIQTVTATANRTISFPDATGTVALVAGSSGQLAYNNAGSNAGLTSASIGSTGDITLSLAGALNTPPVKITGSWVTTGGTGTSTKPQVLIEPTGTTSTGWSLNGTGLGVNAASGFTGNLLDLQVNGTSKLRVSSTGAINAASLTQTGDAVTTSNEALKFVTNSNVSRLYINNTGIGIGVPPIYALHVNAGAASSFGVTNGSVTNLINFSNTNGINLAPGSSTPLIFTTGGSERARFDGTGGLTLADANDIAVGTTTGTKIGTATTQKLGFYNATPVVQPTAVADATDAASVITQLNALLSRMRDLGLIAT